MDDIFSQSEIFEEPELEVSMFSTQAVATAKSGGSGEDPWA